MRHRILTGGVSRPGSLFVPLSGWFVALLLAPLYSLASIVQSGEGLASEPGETRIYLEASQLGELAPMAEELVKRLKECSGLEFTVETKEPFAGKGIRLKVVDAASAPEAIKSLNKEGLSITGTPMGMAIFGNSPLAVQDGIYFYLERLGFRFYFPNPAWHIIPKTRKLYGHFSLVTQPDYQSRRITMNITNQSPEADKAFDLWQRANRMGGYFQVKTGHAWNGIMSRHKAEFEAHKEYYAVLPPDITARRGKEIKENNKFCVSQEGLVQLCIQDALDQITNPLILRKKKNMSEKTLSKEEGRPASVAKEKDLDAEEPEDMSDEVQMISMEPSDGPGYCTCALCQKIGDATEQTFYLANRVAKAIQEKYPGKKVGMYAYYEHAAPPNQPLEPNIFVQICTAFNRSKYSYDQLFEVWSKKIPQLGVREFYGVMAWDQDMPGLMRGGRVDYVRKNIPKQRKAGAVSFQAQSGYGWISRGLGHYVASRLLWDVNAPVDEIVGEFYQKCFGKAAEPARKLFQSMESNVNKVPTSHDLGTWFRLLRETEAMADTAEAKACLDQIKYYLHYVALYHQFSISEDDKGAGLGPYKDILSYCWRVRDQGVCASWAFIRLQTRGRSRGPEYNMKNKDAIWRKDSSSVSVEELEKLIHGDMDRYREIQGLKMVSYADTFKPLGKGVLLPGMRQGAKEAKPGVGEILTLRKKHYLIAQVPQQAGETSLFVSFGHVKHAPQKGILKVYRVDQDVDEDMIDDPLISMEVPMDEQVVELPLGKLGPGTYRVFLEDFAKGSTIQAGKDLKFVISASSEHALRTASGKTPNNLFFYVPKGTSKFAILRKTPLTLRKPDGEKLVFDNKNPLIEVEVRPGDDGVWEAVDQSSDFYLMGIPPYVSSSPGQLLVPENIP